MSPLGEQSNNASFPAPGGSAGQSVGGGRSVPQQQQQQQQASQPQQDRPFSGKGVAIGGADPNDRSAQSGGLLDKLSKPKKRL